MIIGSLHRINPFPIDLLGELYSLISKARVLNQSEG
jgi:hypothetical protein